MDIVVDVATGGCILGAWCIAKFAADTDSFAVSILHGS
jgi:hypothetical protein